MEVMMVVVVVEVQVVSVKVLGVAMDVLVTKNKLTIDLFT